MLSSSLWSTTNCSALMTSRTVELPSSSEVLIATRSASGAMPAYLPGQRRRAEGRVAGDDAGDVRAVADRVTGGRGARVDDHVGDARRAVGVLEVGDVAVDAGVDDGDADALAGDALRPGLVGAGGLREVGGQLLAASTPVVWTLVLSVTLRTPLARLQRRRPAWPSSLTAKPPTAGSLAVTLPSWALTICLRLGLGDRGLELDDRGDGLVRGLLRGRGELGGRRRRCTARPWRP